MNQRHRDFQSRGLPTGLTEHKKEVFRVSAHSHALSLPTPLLPYGATTSKHLCSRSCLPNSCSDLSTSWGLCFASLLQASRVLRPMASPSGGRGGCRPHCTRCECWFYRPVQLPICYSPIFVTTKAFSRSSRVILWSGWATCLPSYRHWTLLN